MPLLCCKIEPNVLVNATASRKRHYVCKFCKLNGILLKETSERQNLWLRVGSVPCSLLAAWLERPDVPRARKKVASGKSFLRRSLQWLNSAALRVWGVAKRYKNTKGFSNSKNIARTSENLRTCTIWNLHLTAILYCVALLWKLQMSFCNKSTQTFKNVLFDGKRKSDGIFTLRHKKWQNNLKSCQRTFLTQFLAPVKFKAFKQCRCFNPTKQGMFKGVIFF